MTIPALRELRRIFPDARIALHTRAWAEGIFRDADFIDEIVAFDKSRSKIKDAFGQAGELRRHGFDLAVLFTNSFETALVAKLAKIPRRFGYVKEGRRFLLTDALEIPVWKNDRHEIFYYLELVAAIEKEYFGTESVFTHEPRVDLAVSAERRRAAREMLAEAGVDPGKTTIALGAGSTNSRAKRWPAEYYARLNDLLQTELGANVLLVGARDEGEVAAEVFEKAEKKPFVLTGRTNLAEAVAVLSEVDLLVSNDMGLAHIAPAVGTKTLVVFGPTNEKTTRPVGSEIIRRTPDCAPCMLRDCPIDHRCMTEISPAAVFARAEKIISLKPDERREF